MNEQEAELLRQQLKDLIVKYTEQLVNSEQWKQVRTQLENNMAEVISTVALGIVENVLNAGGIIKELFPNKEV